MGTQTVAIGAVFASFQEGHAISVFVCMSNSARNTLI